MELLETGNVVYEDALEKDSSLGAIETDERAEPLC